MNNSFDYLSHKPKLLRLFYFLENEEYKVVVNYENNSSEGNANYIPSLRVTLREGMSRHDETGRISKMFFDDVCSIAQSI